MTSSVDKSNIDHVSPPDEKFEAAPSREALSQHEGTAVVRRILWKLDIQLVFSSLGCRPMSGVEGLLTQTH